MKNNAFLMLRLVTSFPQCSKNVYRILNMFDSPEEIFNADKKIFLDTGFNENQLSSLFSSNTSKAEKYLEYCEKNRIKIITYYDEAYPSQLRNLEDPPAILFVKGELPPMRSCPTVGIVGMRECSRYGEKFAAGLAYDLVRTGFIVVSGMAKGIDTYAHKGSLLAGGKTVAVLPSGVDVIYPKRNAELYSRICDTGAVISEYLPGTQCREFNFHLRNRIISGLSHGIVVVESNMRGGSMITVSHASAQGKPVFAVPGSPGVKTSAGTNHLIKTGAGVCSCSEDIISEYEIIFGQQFKRPDRMAKISRETDSLKPVSAEKSVIKECKTDKFEGKTESEKVKIPRPVFYRALSEKEELVINALKDGPLSVDSVCDETGLIFQQVVSVLNGFEITGYVESLPGGLYKLKE